MRENIYGILIMIATALLFGGILTFLYGVPEGLKDIAKQIKNLNQYLLEKEKRELRRDKIDKGF